MLTGARLDFAIAQTRELCSQRCATAIAAKPIKKARLALAEADALGSAASQPEARHLPFERYADPVVRFMFTFQHSRGEVLCARRGQLFPQKKSASPMGGLGRPKGNGQAGEDPAEAGSGSAHSPTITKGACSSRKRGLEHTATFSGYESGSEH